MVVAVSRHHLRALLWSRDAEIANQTAMQRMRVIKVDDLAHKVGTVSLDEIIALAVGLAVEFVDQQRILLRTGLNLESINCPVIRRPDHLMPVSLGGSTVSLGGATVGAIGGERFQVVAAILISKEGQQLWVGEERDRFRPVHRVEVGNQWDRNPSASRDAVVPTQDYAGFAFGTPPQNYRGHRTNIAQIHGHVTRAGESAIVTVRLFQKQRRPSMGARNAAEAEEQNGAQPPKSRGAPGERGQRICENRHFQLR